MGSKQCLLFAMGLREKGNTGSKNGVSESWGASPRSHKLFTDVLRFLRVGCAVCARMRSCHLLTIATKASQSGLVVGDRSRAVMSVCVGGGGASSTSVGECWYRLGLRSFLQPVYGMLGSRVKTVAR